MRSKCDKINTVISNVDEPVILTDNTSSLINSYLNAPEFGTPSCFPGFNEFFRGYLKTKVLFNGFMSNEGKSRYMIRIVCDIALKQKKSCMLLSNEQTENDFHNALVTTVVNNPEFQEMHGIKINKPEKEITMGLYRSDKTHEFMYRKMSPNGDFIETQEEFISRVITEKPYFKALEITTDLANCTCTLINKEINFYDMTDCHGNRYGICYNYYNNSSYHKVALYLCNFIASLTYSIISFNKFSSSTFENFIFIRQL